LWKKKVMFGLESYAKDLGGFGKAWQKKPIEFSATKRRYAR